MDILGKHRIAFNNLGVQLFADLERDLAPALSKGLSDNAELEKVITEQKGLLEERQALIDAHESTSKQQQRKIQEQENRLQNLSYEIAKAEIGNEALTERLRGIEKADRGRQRRALAITQDKSLENKENIPPIFNYLASDTPSRTLTRSISPPLKTPSKPRIQSTVLVDEATQTLFSYKDDEVQTNPVSSLDDLKGEYQELASSYNDIRYELDQYKEAYNRLTGKYAQNKTVWKQWSEQENARLINSKKRRLEAGVASEPRAGGWKFNGYTTPATSVAGGSPASRAPNISPTKPRFHPSVIHSSPKKGGLFSKFLGPGIGETEDIKGSSKLSAEISAVKGGSKEGPEEPPSSPLSNPPSSFISSIPETQAPPGTLRVTANDELRDNDDSTESDDEPKRGDPRGDESAEPVLPSRDPAFTVPRIKREPGTRGCTGQEGDNVAWPVTIKSESHASSEGLGYHISDQESLDLDDIGQKPETPRKRRKPYCPQLEPMENINRPGWINGGFGIALNAGAEETQDVGDRLPIPTLPLPTVTEGKPIGIGTDSQLTRANAPVGSTKGGPGSSPPPFHSGNKNSTTSPPLRRSNRVTSARKTLSPMTKLKQLTEKTPLKSGKRRVATPRAIASLTEDGTDGCDNINLNSVHPPMVLSDEQGKQLEKDTKGTAKLDDVLNSPPPRTPNLAHLKKTIQSRTSPTKKRAWGGDGFEIRQAQPLSSASPSTFTRRIGGNQKARARDLSALDISDFRVNPEVNDGKDYAFVETVRNREARKCLPGCVKTCCRDLVGFTEAAGLPAVNKGPRWRSSSPAPVDDGLPRRALRSEAIDKEDKVKEFTNRFGRHRDTFERRKSPPGFWDADFPTTQELEQQRQMAEEMRRKKVEEMRKEAERGSKGRFLYRG